MLFSLQPSTTSARPCPLVLRPSSPPTKLRSKMKSTISMSVLLVLAFAGVSLTSAFAPAARPFRAPVVSFMSDDETDSAAAGAAAAEGVSEEPPKPAVKCPDCDLCDGSGRILGGIAVVLPWWPIKAYRPCPNFIERGGRYVRSGQALDEIAFGRDSTYDPIEK